MTPPRRPLIVANAMQTLGEEVLRTGENIVGDVGPADPQRRAVVIALYPGPLADVVLNLVRRSLGPKPVASFLDAQPSTLPPRKD